MMLAEVVTHDFGPNTTLVLQALIAGLIGLLTIYLTDRLKTKAAKEAAEEAGKKVAAAAKETALEESARGEAARARMLAEMAVIKKDVNSGATEMRDELKAARKEVTAVSERFATLQGVVGTEKAGEAADIVASGKINAPKPDGAPVIKVEDGDAPEGEYTRTA